MVKFLNMRVARSISSLMLLLMMGEANCPAQSKAAELEQLQKGQVINGFKTEALYTNDRNKAFGARFKHEKSGFIFDLLQIQSVPQAFIWVNTLLSSDSGVAHTQEHLLLGKGNKGRNHGTRTQMSLARETAGTDQWRTYYHFNTTAGAKVFYELLEEFLDILMHPDYTDEEIRREVRNFAVKEDSSTKKLVLEEKGTVYNEMVSTVKDPNYVMWFALMHTLYGQKHPLAFNNGGSPEGIRGLKPAEIRRFHDKNYTLSNMGMIGAVPKEMAVDDVLAQMDAMIARLQKQPALFQVRRDSERPTFPPPQPMPAGNIRIVTFPEKNAQKPGEIMFSWPPRLQLKVRENLLLGFFLGGIAGDAGTPLYKLFVDSKTLKYDSGATGIGGWASNDQGFPITITMSDVAQSHINKKDIVTYRTAIIKEIKRIASWKDDSPELADFNSKMLARLAQSKRGYADFVNKPPSFGSRGSSGFIMKQLLMLDDEGGFRRSVTLKPEFADIEKLLKSKKNIWRDYIAKWHLLDTVPYAIAGKPDPALLTQEEADTKARLQAETERLKKVYAVQDEQEALKRYKADYDAKTNELETLARNTSCKFIDSPPLTSDEHLDYKVTKLAGGVSLLSSTFDSMTSSHVGLMLRLESVAPDDLMYLSMLPELLSSTGVIENGKAISYEDMLKKRRQEIYYLSCYITSNSYTNRYELKVTASGANEAEAKRSVEWMKLTLEHPNWTVKNLHRIRDVIEQSLSSLRHTRDASLEEKWDYGVSTAYRRQDNPLQLNLESFLTETHNAQRLRWLLKGDAEPGTITAFVDFMKLMDDAGSKLKKDEMKSLLESLSKSAGFSSAGALAPQLASLREAYSKLPTAVKTLAADAADVLSADLPDIPDSWLSHDWSSLCREIAHDVQVPPEKTLAKLESIRQSLLLRGGARLVAVGSQSTLKALNEPLAKLAEGLSDAPFKPQTYETKELIFQRMRQREGAPLAQRPVYVGLNNARSQQGIVINTAPAIKFENTDDESLEGELALKLYGGAGAHGLFMKTWGAGLAYGNGASSWPNSSTMYYADKMPSIAETLRFVANELKKAKPDPSLLDYVIAQNFHSRAADDFDERADSMANDLVDNEPPEVVRKYREAILKIRNKPELMDLLFKRMLPEYGKVIPGLGVKGADVAGATHLAIGDEKQLSLYEDYLKSLEGPDTKVYRLWGRDFWVNSLTP